MRDRNYSPGIEALERARSRTLELTAQLDQTQLDWAPEAGRWSVGEILDHLILAERFFRDQVVELIRRTRQGEASYVWRSFADYNPRFSFVPRAALPFLELPFTAATVFFPPALREILTRSRLLRYKNPDVATPRQSRGGDELRRELAASIAETRELLVANADLDFAGMTFSHPLLGTLNVPRLLSFAAGHEERHQAQIREVLERSGFPSAEAREIGAGIGAVRKVRFTSGRGSLLTGVLHAPAQARGALVFSHCFTCTKDYDAAVRFAEILSDAGFAVLRFDYSGVGESEGDFAQTTITTDLEDLQAAIRWMISQRLGEPVLLGHSMGGAVSLLGAAHRPSVPGVAVLATFAEVSSLTRLLRAPGGGPVRPGTGSVTVKIAGRSYTISPGFWQELQRYSLTMAAADYPGPLLVLHGTADRTIDVEQGETLFAAASQPKAFYALPDADHLLSRPQDLELAGQILTAWLGQLFRVGP